MPAALPRFTFPLTEPVTREYVEVLNDALRSAKDIWGAAALDASDGPSRANVGGRLVPLMLGDPTYLAKSGFPYIVCTDSDSSDSFALHVIDGSQIYCERTPHWSTPNWDVPFPRQERSGTVPQTFTFHVGNEMFGESRDRLALPLLRRGWLPILGIRYRDANGVTWQRESFAGTERLGGVLASWARFSHDGSAGAVTELVVDVTHEAVSAAVLEAGTLRVDGRALVIGPSSGTWDGQRLTYRVDRELTLCLLNEPAAVNDVSALDLDAAYEAAHVRACDFWQDRRAAGTAVELPDTEAQEALDNLLLQNLVMQERYSIGNPYEFVFTMEGHSSVEALLAFGYFDTARRAYQRLVATTNGPGPEWYESWERGVKLSGVARYTALSGDASLIDENLGVYEGYRRSFESQMDGDPHGLLTPERYAWDIPDYVYGWHSQAAAWRGLLDVAETLRALHRPDEAATWRATAERLGNSLRDVVKKVGVWLEDGSYFVPVSLLGDELPYDSLTESRLASYWNLVAPYALATGIVPPDSPEGRGLLRYMELHGAWFLGLTRFNGIYDPPTPIGEVAAGGTGGYKTAGIDNAWGVQGHKFLAMSLEGDRVALTLLSKLLNGMTPGTFLDGEATTIGYAPDDVYRSTWYPPNSTSNALYLLALRDAILTEERTPEGRLRLHVGLGLPREWLAPGGGVRVSDLPTSAGLVSIAFVPDIGGTVLDVAVDGPALSADIDVVVHLRVPGRNRFAVDNGGTPVPVDSEQFVVVGPIDRIAATVSIAAEQD